MTDRLWAPWRMEYILSPKSSHCIFCEFAAAGAECYERDLVLVVQAHALVCLNKYPFTPSHLLVTPRRHVSDIADLPPEEYDATMRLVREASVRVRRHTGADGLNIGINMGAVAGAGIADHTHVHIVPRWSGDSNFMPVIADTRVMPEYLGETYRRLRPAFEDLVGCDPTSR